MNRTNNVISNIRKLISASEEKYVIQIFNPVEISSISIILSRDNSFVNVNEKKDESQIKQFTFYHNNILDQLKLYSSNDTKSPEGIFWDNIEFNLLFPLRTSNDMRFGYYNDDSILGFYIPKTQGVIKSTRMFYSTGINNGFIEIPEQLQTIVDKNAQEYVSAINQNQILKLFMKF
jgi:hypothetical protein